MTIAVGIACPKGLVLAADSRTSLITDGKYRIVSDNAHKVFGLSDRFVAVTTGWAFLNGKTIAGVIEGFEARADLAGDTEAAALALAEFSLRHSCQSHLPEQGLAPSGGRLDGRRQSDEKREPNATVDSPSE